MKSGRNVGATCSRCLSKTGNEGRQNVQKREETEYRGQLETLSTLLESTYMIETPCPGETAAPAALRAEAPVLPLLALREGAAVVGPLCVATLIQLLRSWCIFWLSWLWSERRNVGGEKCKGWG